MPELLNGLKGAFLPSAVAIACSLYLKYHSIYTKSKNIEEVSINEDATIKDIILALEKIDKNLNKSLTGDGESSLATILGKMRSEASDANKHHLIKLDELKQVQEHALQEIAKGSTGALIEALKKVIEDFNNELMSQFGENFKQLNDAVGKLLIWQDKYKVHIEEIEAKNTIIADNMAKATDRYETIINKTEVFSIVASNLSNLLDKLEEQKDTLQTQLTALSTLVLNASNGLPKIETQILEIANDLKNAVGKNQTILNASLEESNKLIKDSLKNSSNKIEENSEEFIKSMKNSHIKINDSLESNASTLKSTTDNIKTSIESSLNSTSEQLKGLTNKLSNDIQQNQKTVDESLQSNASKIKSTTESIKTSIESSLNNTSEQLKGLTNKLSNDIQQNQKTVDESLQSNASTIKSTTDNIKTSIESSLNNTSEQLKGLTNKLSNDIQQNQKTVSDNLQNSINKFESFLDKLLSDITTSNNTFNSEMHKKSVEQFNKLETELSATLTKSLGSLAGQLASLSNKFVADYKPLTEKLQKIIEIANNVRM
jgi:ElaB/YqjD/DUF883 family membrane-anchored ribosome-binding protein